MRYIEAKQALCRKLNISWDSIAYNDLFSATDIEDFVKQGAMQAYDYEMWDFAEHSKTATLTSDDVANGYTSHPKEIQPSSIYFVTINGEEFDKKLFQSFKAWFIRNPSDRSKYWAEFKRLIFFNKNAVSVGHVIDIYGKLSFRAPSADDDLLPFSPDDDNNEYSGNQACILLAYAEALASDKKKDEAGAEVERKKAFAILDRLSTQLKQGRSLEQTKDRPMFNVPDLFRGNSRGSSANGTFSY